MDEDTQRYHRLRDATIRLQSRFIEDADETVLFDSLLGDILDITESEYGFINEIHHTADGTPYLKTRAITNIAWNEETRRFYDEKAPAGLEFYNLETLFGVVVTSEKPVIANDPANDPRSGELPEGHPPMIAFLGLPLLAGPRLVGTIGVANRAGGYDEDIVEELAPLLNACAHVIAAYRSAERRRRAEEELRKAHKGLEKRVEERTSELVRANQSLEIEIAERKQAEEALRQSAAQLKAIMDNSPVAIYLKDMEGGSLAINEYTEKWSQATEKKAIGRTIHNFVSKEATEILSKMDHEVLATGVTCQREIDELRHGRTPRTLMVIKFPVRDVDGALFGVGGIEVDITERRRAEEKASRAQSHLEDAVESFSDGFALFDADDRLVLCNERYREAFAGIEAIVRGSLGQGRRGPYLQIHLPSRGTKIPFPRRWYVGMISTNLEVIWEMSVQVASKDND